MAVAKKEAVSAWDEMVEIKLPRANKGEEQNVYVSVNGRNYLINKGVKVSVPKPVAEVLKNAEEAREAAADYSEARADN